MQLQIKTLCSHIIKIRNMHTNPQKDKNRKQITITQYDSKIYFSNLKKFEQKFKKLSAQFSGSDQKEYYIVSVQFIGQWRDFCNTQDLTRLQPLKMNHNLYQDNSTIKPNLVEGADYQIVNKQIYELFAPFIDQTKKNKRVAVTIGRQKKVPIYVSGFTYICFSQQLLKKIDLKKMPFGQLKVERIEQSQEQTFQQLLKAIKEKQNIDKYTQCRLWINQKDLTPIKLFNHIREQLKPCSVASYLVKGVGRRLDQLDAKISDIILDEDNYFIVECKDSHRAKFYFIRDDEGRCEGCHHFGKLQFPCGCNKVRYCSDACLEKDKHFHMRSCSFAEQMELNKKVDMTISKNSKKGLVGLNNLGNTCFMNSCLQCLSNTAPLRQYFLKGYFEDQINKDNPIGTKGKLVKNYAKFIKGLWCDQNDTFAPYNVKNAVSDINPMFSGFAQHDSQQFFSFIVDGLHEDLNRVLKKPYVQAVQEKDKNQEQLARESWIHHLKRNQSIIVDTMAGQYKSRVTCPDCKHYSTTFDPYITVTLPIPQKTQSVTDVFFIFSNMHTKTKRAWFKYTTSDANQWIEQAAKAGGVDQKSWRLYVVSIYEDLYKFGRDSTSQLVNKVQNDNKNMFMFELSKEQLEIPEQKKIEFVGRYSKKSHQFQNAWFKMPFTFDKTSLKGIDIFMRMLKFLYNQAFDDAKKRSFFGGKSYQEYEKQMLKQRPFDLVLRYNKRIERGYHKTQLKFENYLQIQDQMQILDQMQAKGILINDCQLDARFKKEMSLKFSFERLKQFDTIGRQPKASRSEDAQVQLDQCFSSFNQPQTLEKGNQWYCPKCKQHKLANKQLSIYRAPKVLILHLKRFKQKGSYRKQKNQSKVVFPLQLDMSKYLINPRPMSGYKAQVQGQYIQPKAVDLKDQKADTESKPIYELYAVSNHFGGLGGGHYTAFAKNQGQWYDFNDSHVSKASFSSVCSSGAYLLFYERKN